MQYLFRRIQGGENISSANLPLYGNSREEFPELASCIDHISSYIEHSWGTRLTDDEKLYLLLHVNRICSQQNQDQNR